MQTNGARAVLLSLSISIAGGVAWADPAGEAALDRALLHPAPGPGLERARVAPPGWCGRLEDRDDGWENTLAEELDQLHHSDQRKDTSDLLNAARTVCTAPTAPAAQRAAAEILQDWINMTGMPAADATVSLAARFDRDAFEAAQQALCDGPLREVDDGELDDNSGAKHVSEARRKGLGCDGTPQWEMSSELYDLAPYVDRGPIERDPIAHATWILYRTNLALDAGERPERVLPGYVIDQFDLRAVAPDELRRLANTAPYQGNMYAHAVLLETAGAIGLAATRYEAAVAAKTKDPSWKELLVTAPQRGAAAWEAAAKRHADALARSDAFAQTAAYFEARSSGSPTRGTTCEKQLEPDMQAIAKALPHGNVAAFRQAISDDPVAGLLLHRLMICRLASGDEYPGDMLHSFSVRLMGGPRMAAYYAAIDSGAADGAHVHLSDLPSPTGRDESDNHGEHEPDDTGNNGGVIASVTKIAGGAVRVAYVQKHVRYMSQKCVETNKPDRIMPDGTIIYRKACHDAGMAESTEGAPPIEMSAQFAVQLRPGRYVSFDRNLSNWPLFVFSDPSRKHLLAFAGISLE